MHIVFIIVIFIVLLIILFASSSKNVSQESFISGPSGLSRLIFGGGNEETAPFTSEIDQKPYNVSKSGDHEYKKTSSNTLAKINAFLSKFIIIMHVEAGVPLKLCPVKGLTCLVQTREVNPYEEVETADLREMFNKKSVQECGYIAMELLKRRDNPKKLDNGQVERVAYTRPALYAKANYILENLKKRYGDTTKIFEVDPNDGSKTSYVTNKGVTFNMCIRNKGRTVEDMDVLKFVALHELAHLGTDTVGHDNNFWTTFKLFLLIAQAYKILPFINFSEEPRDYCGMRIENNPITIKGFDVYNRDWLAGHFDPGAMLKYNNRKVL